MYKRQAAHRLWDGSHSAAWLSIKLSYRDGEEALPIQNRLQVPLPLSLIHILKTVDVKPVGPNQSKIGLASINQFLFNHLGANSIWYSITNLLGVIAIFFAVGFAISGLCQFIKGKSISKVDFHLLLLGALYILVIVFYIFFEFVIINYRPVLIDSELEASYPSSHTMITI